MGNLKLASGDFPDSARMDPKSFGVDIFSGETCG